MKVESNYVNLAPRMDSFQHNPNSLILLLPIYGFI